MRIKPLVVAALTAAMLIVPVATVRADEMTAILDDQRILLSRAAELSCHDFEYPVIRCFESSKDMLLAIDDVREAGSEAEVQALATGYVVVWADANFGGASRSLSRNYAFLNDIGWNDRISSLRSYGATGRFHEHSPNGGFVYGYSSSAYVTYVGNAYNDKFSAFEIN